MAGGAAANGTTAATTATRNTAATTDTRRDGAQTFCGRTVRLRRTAIQHQGVQGCGGCELRHGFRLCVAPLGFGVMLRRHMRHTKQQAASVPSPISPIVV